MYGPHHRLASVGTFWRGFGRCPLSVSKEALVVSDREVQYYRCFDPVLCSPAATSFDGVVWSDEVWKTWEPGQRDRKHCFDIFVTLTAGSTGHIYQAEQVGVILRTFTFAFNTCAVSVSPGLVPALTIVLAAGASSAREHVPASCGEKEHNRPFFYAVASTFLQFSVGFF